MDLYCVMGNPVAHSRSPWIHARFAELTGQTLRYERQLAPLDGFAATVMAFRAAGGRGCNVTVPFKLEAAALATWHSPRRGAGRRRQHPALRRRRPSAPTTPTASAWWPTSPRNAGVPLAGRDVLLIGAGGAAAGVLGPLIGQRPRRIVIANRTLARADELVQRHAALAAHESVTLQACALDDPGLAGDFDVVINATASSLGGAGVPVPRIGARSPAPWRWT